MRDIPEVYTVSGTYNVGGLRGHTCSVSLWTRYERHDAVVREARSHFPWMTVKSVVKFTGTTYGGIPLRDLREAMAKHLL